MCRVSQPLELARYLGRGQPTGRDGSTKEVHRLRSCGTVAGGPRGHAQCLGRLSEISRMCAHQDAEQREAADRDHRAPVAELFCLRAERGELPRDLLVVRVGTSLQPHNRVPRPRDDRGRAVAPRRCFLEGIGQHRLGTVELADRKQRRAEQRQKTHAQRVVDILHSRSSGDAAHLSNDIRSITAGGQPDCPGLGRRPAIGTGRGHSGSVYPSSHATGEFGASR